MGQLADIVRQSRALEPETRTAYLRCVTRFESSHRGETWTAYAVERWRDSLLSRGLSAQTVNKHLYALKYASRRREALGQGPDFARAAEAAKVHKKGRRTALDQAILIRLLETTSADRPVDLRDRAIIVLMARTGIRVSGLTGLLWSDIRGRRVKVRLKGGDEHTVILDDEAAGALDDWRKAGPKSGPVFPSIKRSIGPKLQTGGAMTRQAVHQMIAERAKRAKIARPVHPHLLRHTFVSRAFAAGIPAYRIMGMTGHKSLGSLSGYVTDLEAESDPVGGHLPPLLKRRPK